MSKNHSTSQTYVSEPCHLGQWASCGLRSKPLDATLKVPSVERIKYLYTLQLTLLEVGIESNLLYKKTTRERDMCPQYNNIFCQIYGDVRKQIGYALNFSLLGMG